MKRPLLVVFACVTLGACQTAPTSPSDTSSSASSAASLRASNGSSMTSLAANAKTYAATPCTSADSSTLKLDIDFTITIPCDYDLARTEYARSGRHGSFAYYEGMKKNYSNEHPYPYFRELYFLDESSVPEKQPDCQELCVETRTKATYNALKAQWTRSESTIVLGATKYIVRNGDWPGSSLREYITFAGDVEIDLHFELSETPTAAEKQAADSLVRVMAFTKN